MGNCFGKPKNNKYQIYNNPAPMAPPPTQMIDHVMQGNMLLERQDYFAAIACYNAALAVNAKDIYAIYNKGSAYAALKDHISAITQYDEALKINPKFVLALNARGDAYTALDQKTKALEAYEKAIAIDPSFFYAWNNKGNILYAQNKKAEALVAYEKAISANPSFAVALHNRANTLASLAKYIDAVVAYDQVIALNPHNPVYYCGKGRVLLHLGQDAQANACFDRATAIVESGHVNEADKEYVSKLLDKEKLRIIEKLREVTAIQLDSMEEEDTTPTSTATSTSTLSQIKQFAKSKLTEFKSYASKRMDELQNKASVSQTKERAAVEEAVEALNSDSAVSGEQLQAIMTHLESVKKERLSYNDEIEQLRQELRELDAKKTDRAEVSYAISTNTRSEDIVCQMQMINSNAQLRDYYDALVFTFSQTYTTAQAILSEQLELDVQSFRDKVVSKMLSIIPIVGDIMSEAMYILKETTIKKNAAIFSTIASNHSELDKLVENIARFVTLSKKSELMDTDTSKVVSGWFRNSIMAKIKKYTTEIKEKIEGDRYNTDCAKQGYQDACILIELYINKKVNIGDSSQWAMLREALTNGNTKIVLNMKQVDTKAITNTKSTVIEDAIVEQVDTEIEMPNMITNMGAMDAISEDIA